MSDFISDDDVPPYAILSHTWGEEEVNFHDWEKRGNRGISTWKGYEKVKQFSERAALDGFDWVWIDTYVEFISGATTSVLQQFINTVFDRRTSCCIDKKSSAELSEAINTMFRWYKNAAVCYVYLSDCEWCPDATVIRQRLRQSRWFTRGWTLQELIAPRFAKFYAKDWRKIADKEELYDLLSDVTGIDEAVLQGASVADISVARRMSWASRRKTSRGEDMAYSLLGLFDVNIPLIYGEGRLKAFRRLQEAIMNTTHDQSLFAWGRVVEWEADSMRAADFYYVGREPLEWKPPEEREPLLGLFAESPADFESSGNITPVDHAYAHILNRDRPPTMVNGGALVNIVIFSRYPSVIYWDDPAVTLQDFGLLAVLLCRYGDTGSTLVGLGLHRWGDGYCSRTTELFLLDTFVSQNMFQSCTNPKHIMPHRAFRLHNGDILLRRWLTRFKEAGVEMHRMGRGPAWRQRRYEKVLRLEENSPGDEYLKFLYQTQPGEGVAVILKRLSKKRDPLGAFMIGVCQTECNKDQVGGDMANVKWAPKNVPTFGDPELSHVMATPSDSCQLSLGGGIRIDARVDRRALNQGGHVDVMDFIMYKEGNSPEEFPVSNLR